MTHSRYLGMGLSSLKDWAVGGRALSAGWEVMIWGKEVLRGHRVGLMADESLQLCVIRKLGTERGVWRPRQAWENSQLDQLAGGGAFG